MRTLESSPHPSILIESLRDFGYSLESALADIIDNSLAAGATRVNIYADFEDGDAYIAITDNGNGMSDDQLFEAMRLGSQSPLDERESHDLGRFGLGLKTASFSQCRQLTVISKRDGTTSAAKWDLDHVSATNEWSLIIPGHLGSLPAFETLGRTGTLVIWQKLDRLLEKSDRKSNEIHFAERMAEARSHLELVYHRFLVREGSMPAIVISINDRPLEPNDPFLRDHRGTQPNEVETITINNQKISLRAFTLPSRKSVSRQVWERVGGKEGHVRNQGFYIYRSRRLIIWGTWFGLAPKSEANKLARVQVDIGNDTDADWKIDVLKSGAQPPLAVRQHMRLLIEKITEGSRNVNIKRPRQAQQNMQAAGWITVHDTPYTRFVPNLGHPTVEEHMQSLTAEQKESFQIAIKMLSSSLPLDHIHARMSNKPEEIQQPQLEEEDLRKLVTTVVTALRNSGMDDSRIRTTMRYDEPFRSQWDSVKHILETL